MNAPPPLTLEPGETILWEGQLEITRRPDVSGRITFAGFGVGGRLGFKHLAGLSAVEPLVRQLAGMPGCGGAI